MKFIETPVFTSSVHDLLSEEEYRAFQLSLLLKPTQGALIPGAGGIRKLRIGSGGKGKRGGARVLYYWHGQEETIYLLMVYAKARKENLTSEQLMILRDMVREEFK